MLTLAARRCLLAVVSITACAPADADELVFDSATTTGDVPGSSAGTAAGDGSSGPDTSSGGDSTGAGGESSESGGGDSTGEEEELLVPNCDDATMSTQALGWTEGSEVGAALTEVLAGLSAGDVLCLDAMYDLRPADTSFVVPAGVTLAARAGAGLRVLDVPSVPNGGLLELSSDVTLSNLTIVDEGELFGDDAPILNNRNLVVSRGTSGITLHNCHIDSYAKNLVLLHDVDGFTIAGTHLAHSFYQLFLTGQTQGGEVTDTLFEHSDGDGIKTGHRNSSSVRNIHIQRSAFEHNLRDGIDTTGGFRGSVVEETLFYDLFAGFDIKTIYEQDVDTQHPSNNQDITIRNCDFIDPGTGALVVTSLDRVGFMTDDNAPDHLTHDIEVFDSIVEQRDRESRAMLIKDGHDIVWDGLLLLGEANESRIFDLAQPGDYGARPLLSETNWNVEARNVMTGPVRPGPPQRPFDEVGPR